MKRILISIGGMVVVAALPARVASQSTWLDIGPRSSVTVQFLKPNVTFDDDLTFWNYGLFITSRTVVSDPIALVFELPVAHASGESILPLSQAESETQIGNIYVGMDVGPSDNPTYRVELGVRLPTAQENKDSAALMGIFADIERFGATIPQLTTVNLLFNASPQLNDVVRLRMRIGPSAFLPEDDDNEVSLNFSTIVIMENPQFRVNAGISAFTFLTTNDSAFGSEASVYILGIGGGPKFGDFYTAVDIRWPLAGDAVEDLKQLVGVSVAGFFDMSGSGN